MSSPDVGRLLVDSGRCEGYGLCEQAAPDLVHLNDEDELVVDIDEIDPGSRPLADAAVRACPVAALRIQTNTPSPT
ncbi:MAG: ferredoxin [Alcaligenaceae bacterium]|nr:MAG: ferredoxin [Alcaligenaceae bacterium]